MTHDDKSGKGPGRDSGQGNLIDVCNCICCPRECRADRTGAKLGWCKSGDEIMISSICAHRGEEPVFSGHHGICNIFFSHCNMQCIYCQNYQISRVDSRGWSLTQLDEVVTEIESVLARGAKGVGFVSPSHCIPQMLQIIDRLGARGHNQPYVFNTNGYDRVDIVRSLEGIIDVYLPDLKYMDEKLGREYSDTRNYPEIATAAIREMYRQKGANIYLDDEDVIKSGLIIRHLVLPGQVENSRAVLRWIAEELSPSVHISLMSQYYPTPSVRNHPLLGRTLHPDEYEAVIEEFERLGFWRGWVQELGSPHSYRPDFDLSHPFEPDRDHK
ncbi:MAG: radical SAM protein [Candidatus Zixiibacteriota bacterium]